jgi:radical SAM superfamily enzyme YgiQ (UPF0313 family)
MKYREPLFRPPAEADSLIIQAAYGCPHNTCRFCAMYKSVKYVRRNHDELMQEIAAAGKIYSSTSRIFLADGDIMHLPFNDLKLILQELNQHFPNLARVNLYANGSSINAKTSEQLMELKSLKLSTLYLGLESGSQQLLDLVNKHETVSTMIDAVNSAQNAGLKCSVMFLLGLGGKQYSQSHAEATARAINIMQPRILSALRFIEVLNLPPFPQYQTLSEYDAVEELHTIVGKLELNKTVFRANHSSNPVPLSGRFPQDRARMLFELEHLLRYGRLDKNGPGATPMFL